MNISNNIKKSLFNSVIILTISNLIVKIIGVIFKIPLHNMLGDLGMGYFNSAYNIYVMFYIILTTGLPVASTILISKELSNNNYNNIRKIFKISLFLLTILGILGFLVMFLLSKYISILAGNSDIVYSVKAISLAIVFLCIVCVFRGYFQGLDEHKQTAVSEILESIGKFVFGLILALYALNKGYSIELCSAYAVFGVVIGEFLAFLYMIISYYKNRMNYTKSCQETDTYSNNRVLNDLIKLSFPIFLAAFILNLTSNADTFTIVNILKPIIGVNEAESIFGNYSTLAITLFRIPSAFIIPISVVLIPSLVKAKTENNVEEQNKLINISIKLLLIISIPSTIALALLSKPILGLLFNNEESINQGYLLLSYLAFSIIPSSYLTISSAILQSYGKQTKPIISTGIGVVIKVVLNIVLISNSKIGIYGAPIATFISYIAMCITNHLFIKKYVPIKIFRNIKILRIILTNVVTTVIMMGSYYITKLFLNDRISILITIILTIIIYGLLLVLFKVVTKEELKIMPIVSKFTKNA